jgi:quinolinate synthase
MWSTRSLHVRQVTGRENLRIWPGQCHVHEGISGQILADRIEAQPDADVLVHPECACATAALTLAHSGVIAPARIRIVSTGGMLDEAHRTTARQVIVATETGMLHQLRRANPGTEFSAVSEHAVCPYMKMITPAKLLRCLREGKDEVTIDEDVAAAARVAVERMIAIGRPAAGAR